MFWILGLLALLCWDLVGSSVRDSKSWSSCYPPSALECCRSSVTGCCFDTRQTLPIFCTGVLPGIPLFGKLSGSRLKYPFIEETAVLIRGLLKWRTRKQLQFAVLNFSGSVQTPSDCAAHFNLHIQSVDVVFHKLAFACLHLGCHCSKCVFCVTVVNLKCFSHAWEEGLWGTALCSLVLVWHLRIPCAFCLRWTKQLTCQSLPVVLSFTCSDILNLDRSKLLYLGLFAIEMLKIK